VNGDGYSDVIVGAYNFDNRQTDKGRAYVYMDQQPALPDRPHGLRRVIRLLHILDIQWQQRVM